MFNYIFLVNQTQLGYNYDPIKNIIRKTPNLKKKNSILTPQNTEYQNQTITKQILKELEDESLMYGLPLENRVAEEEEKERESSEEILQEAMVLNKTHSQYCMSLFLIDSFEPNSVYIMAFTSKFCTNEWFLLIFFVFEYFYYYYCCHFQLCWKEMISVTHQKRAANQPVAKAKAKANPYPNAIILELSLLGSGNR